MSDDVASRTADPVPDTPTSKTHPVTRPATV